MRPAVVVDRLKDTVAVATPDGNAIDAVGVWPAGKVSALAWAACNASVDVQYAQATVAPPNTTASEMKAATTRRVIRVLISAP